VIARGQSLATMSADYWTEDEARRALKELDASGLTIAAFGRRTGIAEKRLRWWRKRLAAAPAARSTTLVPVRIKPASPTAASAPPLEVVLGDVVVRVPTGFDAETLARVLDVLDPGC
jgi:transposase